MRFPFGKKKQEETEANQGADYKREKSNYEKVGEDGEFKDEEGHGVSSPTDPEALARLREDPEIRALLAEVMGDSNSSDRDSIQDMVGKGVSTLANSIKKATRGDDDVLEVHDDEEG